MDHNENVIAAAALAVSDEVRFAVEQAAGRGGGAAAALIALADWGDGHPIEELAAGLRLSHSRMVRVVDALESDGLAARRPSHSDRRKVQVCLTAAGRRTGRRMLKAREVALRRTISGLSDVQRNALAAISEVLLAESLSSVADASFRCRYCDSRACGHTEGRCPVTRKFDSLQHVPGAADAFDGLAP